VIEKLRKNCHLSKHTHFEAAKRGRNLHVAVGMPVVIINVLVGSLLFALIKADVPNIGKWIGGVLALAAAVLSAVQTFFNFKEGYEGHRSVANQYLAIARECERLIALFLDGQIALDSLSNHVQDLNVKYAKVNAEAEKYMTTDADYEKAKEIRAAKDQEPSPIDSWQYVNDTIHEDAEGQRDT
jgi:hypothetical protein